MILVINTGSSSVKFAVYGMADDGATSPLCRGQVKHLGSSPRFSVSGKDTPTIIDLELDAGSVSGHSESVEWILSWIDSNIPGAQIAAVGHRVVHGGAEFTTPVIVDKEILKELTELEKHAPLHQPYNVAGITAIMKSHPGITQVACFDTAFHRTQPKVSEMFGIPDEYFKSGVRRYGFHGLSYEYIVSKMHEIDPAISDGRLIAAHLGNGASMCAIDGGKSIATTMGFTALDGLPMGTRSGSIDPGVIFYLIRDKGFTIEQVEDLLYRKSGLLGISGITNDMETLTSSKEPGARLAVEYFTYRCIREMGSLTAALGGLDALVFTGGIGENSSIVRERVCRGLGWLGIGIEKEKNAANEELISTPGISPAVYVIQTNEELVIALHTAKALKS